MYRRKLRHSRVKSLYKFASFKTGCTHIVESSLEFDACYHFEYSSQVKAFFAQPLGFTYLFDGKANPYTPDFKILSHSKKTSYIEVKPHSKTLHSDFVKKFHAKKEAAYQLGFELILITDIQIRELPALNNFKLLHRYAGFHTHSDVYDNVYDVVKKCCPIYLNAIFEFFEDNCRADVIASILSLIASGKIKANVREKNINDNLLLWM
ncbi:TnsA endonuclease N-terminal domain-containing protein [Vreelandella rituensis]|uniref:Endonuclease n=1 Tax=Vreelandella rituensis TaxID=2282306 RepID=A0A368TU55_9GAMM|nr:TnsA endonuclease N-terminal domain-containing protein [Halomonas rituensis]RCV88285.1 endonuclease [Halomonas rituensis]